MFSSRNCRRCEQVQSRVTICPGTTPVSSRAVSEANAADFLTGRLVLWQGLTVDDTSPIEERDHSRYFSDRSRMCIKAICCLTILKKNLQKTQVVHRNTFDHNLNLINASLIRRETDSVRRKYIESSLI